MRGMVVIVMTKMIIMEVTVLINSIINIQVEVEVEEEGDTTMIVMI
jgi:hypothetical protein